jgi:group I intron endonuclease
MKTISTPKIVWSLYKIINLINGKVYIGQTSKKVPSERWAQHCYKARIKINHPLYNSINKYNRDNFKFEVIACCLTQEAADITEEQLIIQYDSRNRDKGYNLAPGGSSPRLGSHHSDKTKQLWSEHRKGKHFSKRTEFKKNMIPWNKGKTFPSKKLTPEQITDIKSAPLSISNNKLGKHYGVDHKTIKRYRTSE